MNRRMLLCVLAAAGAFSVGFGITVLPAADAQLPPVNVPGVGDVTLPDVTTVLPEVPVPTPAPPAQAPTQPPQDSGTPAPSSGDGGGGSTPTPTPGASATPGSAEPSVGGVGGQQETTHRDDSAAAGDEESDSGDRAKKKAAPDKQVDPADPGRHVDGSPTVENPSFSLALPGPAPIGVPNFFIDKFRIPPFLLPIYQAAGIEYGIRWEVLAAINEIETDYGRNLNVSTAGAVGWMQFMPATWKTYGVDGNKDKVKDPYNPVDAIFAAARYLRAAGADKDLRRAVFAYNHADWYVDSVLLRARVIGGLPTDLVGSLTGLTQGRFPVLAKATYADDIDERDTKKKVKRGDNAAYLIEARDDRRGIRIFARRGAPVVAVNDGRIVRVGHTKRLGRFVQLQDVYGNTYTYAHLAKVEKRFPAPKERKVTRAQVRRELDLPKDPKPAGPASTTDKPARDRDKKAAANSAKADAGKASGGKERLAANADRVPAGPATSEDAAAATAQAVETIKERLFANPARPRALRAGGDEQLVTLGSEAGYGSFAAYLRRVFGLKRSEITFKDLKRGARVSAGTILGRVGQTSPRSAPHVLFEIRPAGRGAPRIDPKPILDGWKLLESTAIYRAAGKNPLFGPDAREPSIGQILLMSKEALVQHVLSNPRIEVYECGRNDIRTGQVDRRVLATLEFLAASGLKPTVTSLHCGHGFYTASGNVSEHSSGNAVDIAAINGIPIVGHQGKGSITELAVQRLLTLQGMMKPHQIITLMKFEGADNTFAMADHYDHIHVGYHPLYGSNPKASKQVNAILKPKQWIKLIDRLGSIENPRVRLEPSKYAVKVTKRASRAHRGE